VSDMFATRGVCWVSDHSIGDERVSQKGPASDNKMTMKFEAWSIQIERGSKSVCVYMYIFIHIKEKEPNWQKQTIGVL